MATDPTTFEIRCPVHGFIGLSAWERRIIDHPAFQRLRRIKQLAWTDYVYPGATHSRFEHSLGVMYIASRLFDSIVENSGDLLRRTFQYNQVGLERDRQKVRLAALLHDVGHAPFSHATESLMPSKQANQSLFGESPSLFDHEDYSMALIAGPLREVIDDDISNKRNFAIRSDEIAAILRGSADAGPALFWRELISGQLDADRMDYLLRDSHHAGVMYGRFDLNRLVSTICAFGNATSENDDPKIGILRGGSYAAEGLILARYSMHKQVYFHKTRLACNVHICNAVGSMLPEGRYPRPDTAESLAHYLGWDDFRVMSEMTTNAKSDGADRLSSRNHYRLVYQSDEASNDLAEIQREAALFDSVESALRSCNLVRHVESPKNTWYKNSSDIRIVSEEDRDETHPLSEYSPILRAINIGRQRFIFADKRDVSRCKEIIKEVVTESQKNGPTTLGETADSAVEAQAPPPAFPPGSDKQIMKGAANAS